MRYEFEDYKTKNREVIDTKENEIIDVGKVIGGIWGATSLLLDEFVVANFFMKKGYRIIRLPLNKQHPTTRYEILILSKDYGITETSCLFGAGCPDFLITKDNIATFIEVKKDDDINLPNNSRNEKNLNPNQLKWAAKYNYPLKIVRIKPFKSEKEDESNNIS